MQPGQPLVQQRARLYVFTYDWRQDIVKTVGKLDELIEQIRRDYGDPYLRVDVIAHSMGGLIVRYFERYGTVDVLDGNSFPVTGARPLKAAPRRAARHAEPGHGHRRAQVPERLPRRDFRAADRGRRDHAIHVPAVSASAGGLGRQHQRQAARLRRLRRRSSGAATSGRSSTTASSAAWTAIATFGRSRTCSSAGSRSASSAAAASRGR